MTVKELKELLDKMPENLPVNMRIRQWGEFDYRYYVPSKVYKEDSPGWAEYVYIEEG